MYIRCCTSILSSLTIILQEWWVTSEKKWRCQDKICVILTWYDEQPTTDKVYFARLDEGKQNHTDNTEKHNYARKSNKEGRCLKWIWYDGAEITEASLANQVLTRLEDFTELIKSKISSAITIKCISNPLRLDEDNDVNDGKANCEDSPHHSHCSRIANIFGVVNPGGFLGLVLHFVNFLGLPKSWKIQKT